MAKVKIILFVAILALIISTAWQIATWEFAFYELQDDLKDVAALNGARIGLDAPSSDDDLRDAVVLRAQGHGIHIDPRQVIVERTGSHESARVYLATSYKVRVMLPGYSFVMQFKPTSRRAGF